MTKKPSLKQTASVPITPVPVQTVKPADEQYFVLVHNPLELRRQILESSKKTIHCLQCYQRLILIRHKKQLEIRKLEELNKELQYLSKKVKEYIPDYKGALIEEVIKSKKTTTKKQIIVQPQPKPVLKEKTELEKLEDSLAQIEKELQRLR